MEKAERSSTDPTNTCTLAFLKGQCTPAGIMLPSCDGVDTECRHSLMNNVKGMVRGVEEYGWCGGCALFAQGTVQKTTLLCVGDIKLKRGDLEEKTEMVVPESCKTCQKVVKVRRVSDRVIMMVHCSLKMRDICP